MSTKPIIKIATRTSALALWQAHAVRDKLLQHNYHCEIVPVESTGDMQLTQPIYAMGISGVFTHQLDIALLEKQADIAVHSLKDVPTQLAAGLTLAAVLERGASQDVVLIKNKNILADNLLVATIATSSLRRSAQWLSKFPHHKIVPIRGNVQTRLRKFEENKEMSAVIFAKAGLERLGLLPENAITLDWMLPAPAQGIIGIVCRSGDEVMKEAIALINHHQTFIEGAVERQFLRTLMGGCSVPISALASVVGNELGFKGAMHAYNGNKSFEVHRMMLLSEWKNAGKESAEKLLLQSGAEPLIEEIRNKTWDEKSSLN